MTGAAFQDQTCLYTLHIHYTACPVSLCHKFGIRFITPFFCGTVAQIGPRPSRLGFLDHTHTDTLGRTPLNEWSPQETTTHARSGIRNRDPNNRATAKLHLRPHGHGDQIPDFTPRQQCLFQQAPDSKPLQNYGALNYALNKRGGLENTHVSGRHGCVNSSTK